MSYLYLPTLTLLLAMIGMPSVQRSRPDLPTVRMAIYDPETEITIEGTVESADEIRYINLREVGLYLKVKTGNDTIPVHLGPAALVYRTMTFEPGDQVRIIGSKVTMNDEPAMVAREVSKGGKVLTLRDERGRPVWASMRRPIT